LAFSSPDAAAQGCTLAAAAAATAAAVAAEDDVGATPSGNLQGAGCFFCVGGLTTLEPHSGSLLQGPCGTSHKDQLAFDLDGL
jgi:hypothetical protein